MKLLNEIIDILSDEQPNLNNALIKTKILLHRLGEKEIISWVNSELTGYTEKDIIPEYRILNLSTFANVTNGYYYHSDRPISVQHLDKSLRDKLSTHRVKQSIAVIESYAKDDKNITISIAPELYPLLGKNFTGDFHVDRAWGKPSLGSMIQIVTEVRSRLLDFILNLYDKIPNELDEEEMKKISKDIGTSELFNNAVFHENTNIFIGNHNKQNLNISIIKNDFESLSKFLKANNVEQNDVDDLKLAIDKDNGSPENEKKEFGKNVKNWIKNMLFKATESLWNINLNIASSIIADALKAYYGW